MTDPKPLLSDEQLEQVRRMTANLGASIQAAGEAIARAYLPRLQEAVRAMRPLVELANSPYGQAVIAAHKARVESGLFGFQPCHCLCGKNHPGESLCRGEIATADAATLRYGSREADPIDVPMCPPCARAVLTAATT